MTVVTRFAPSPTGYLHIGGARTALFNWLYARRHKGKFFLRIEDTDRARSTPEATQAILDGLKWLGLDWDGEPYYQFSHAERHAQVAHELVKLGHAYPCYTPAEELTRLREEAKAEKKVFRFVSPWRDKSAADAPAGAKPSIRIKAPLSGSITIKDAVQGEVTVDARELDDMVILRSDGTPTYMLAVVVDDHDMGVTQIIRGDDHFTNSFRQRVIYDAMGWEVPLFAHIPLIHGSDGAKLSKRHGALGVQEYEKMGYLPEAVRNYLLRLGWAHGDDETISTEQAIEWFGLEGVGKSPSRFDTAKLDNLNGHYIREADDARLVNLIAPGAGESEKALLKKAMPGLKARAKTVKELSDNALFYIAKRPLQLNDKAREILDKGGREVIVALLPKIEALTEFTHDGIQQLCKDYADAAGQKLGNIAQPLRAALSGSNFSPGVFEVMEVLGKDETLGRLNDVC